jgi:N-acetyl-gamma-glutamyl-phosphate reductase
VTTAIATDTLPVFLHGASGMLGGELIRLLEGHPVLKLEAAVSRDPGADVHPNCPDLGALVSADEAQESLAALSANGEPACVVLGLPHGESAAAWTRLKDTLGPALENVTVVDLAADFRLRDPARYAAAYGRAHPCPDELDAFAYGLPELFRAQLQGARRIAAPGCFATALQLATWPAASAGLLDTSSPWFLSGVTGSSGSGATPKPTTHHPHRHGNLWAYALGGHRHEAELAQTLAAFGAEPPLHFVAHSGPFARGIHLTAALPLARPLETAEAHDVYARAYAGEPFAQVLADGVPDLRSVVGSNRAALAVSVRGSVLNVVLTLDNLIKGGAGQALQCLNVALGLPETYGLPRSGLGVC